MISEDFENLFKRLKTSIEVYKDYLLNTANSATEDDKRLFGIMMFKYGALLAAKSEYVNMSKEDKLRVDLIVADTEAFIEIVNEMC